MDRSEEGRKGGGVPLNRTLWPVLAGWAGVR